MGVVIAPSWPALQPLRGHGRGEAKIWGLVPKEQLPTYSVFYEGRTSDRGHLFVRTSCTGRSRSAISYFGLISEWLPPRSARTPGAPDGPMRRRTLFRRRAGGESLGRPRSVLACTPLEGKCWRLVRLTGNAPWRTPMPWARTTGLSSTAADSSFRTASTFWTLPGFAKALRALSWILDRTLRLRAENTTWRTDRQQFASSHPLVPTIEVPRERFSTQREGLPYPVPLEASFFLPTSEPLRPRRQVYCEELLDALALGVGDYFEKNRVFRSIGIALSGGRDSLLTLLIAHRYASKVRPPNPGSLLNAFYMPSRFSSEGTRTAAESVCRELGVPFQVVPIEDAFNVELAAARSMLSEGEALSPLAEQNIQARIRGQRMWTWSNSTGALFLQTGNMSERAVGYTTIGGDLMGALAVIANVPKTVVMYLLDYLQETLRSEGIRQVLSRPAGPEARAQPGGRRGADAVPHPGRVLLSLR